jgi:hypothetical protein
MKDRFRVAICSFLILALQAWTPAPAPTPTPTGTEPAKTPSSTSTRLPPVATPTPTPTLTASPTATPSPIPIETGTPSQTPAPITGLVLEANAPIFSGPGTNYLFLASFNDGILLEVIGTSQDGDWLVIKLPLATTGWIVRSRVEIDLGGAELAAFDTPPTPLPTITPAPVPHLIVEQHCAACPPGTSVSVIFVYAVNFRPEEYMVLTVTDPEGNVVGTDVDNAGNDGRGFFAIPKSAITPGITYTYVVVGDQGTTATTTYTRPGSPGGGDEDE